jgi:acetyltransferase-like isoleucine patch superfamily enzyme
MQLPMPSAALVQRVRIAWFRRQWTCADVRGAPELRAPVVLAGPGTISFEGGVAFGWEQGPGFFSGYSYVEARAPASRVAFGEGTHLNNGAAIVSEGPGVSIGRRCLIGTGVTIYDSDFHSLDAEARHAGAQGMAAVVIEDDVFLGTKVIVLKGVTVGAGSVVGAGAVVVADVPPKAVVAGNPARAGGG